MRKMTDEEFLAEFQEALDNGHICVYYQPKYNHATGRLIGAEALMRWIHPVHGLQSPADFIPVLEYHGLIHKADLCVFEQVCKFLDGCPDNLRVPVSFNVSRYDLVIPSFIDDLEAIRQKYDLSVKYLRAEITESSALGGLELVSSAICRFHTLGYLVAMDDFGSGYSSLSILKNLPVDILKLDLHFLSGEGLDGRAGIILNSAVQMAKWLQTLIIAEGVETEEQADFLQSIGCHYIQGFLYSKPLPPEQMLLLMKAPHGNQKLDDYSSFCPAFDVKRFWVSDSVESLFFNHFSGPAAIVSITGKHVRYLRINEKYVKLFGAGFTSSDFFSMNPMDTLDFEDRMIYYAAYKEALSTGKEVVCDTWRNLHSRCCGMVRMYIRSTFRVLVKSGHQVILYVMAQNITHEKESFDLLEASERKLRHASEQANIYAWEYHVDTKEMFPCFRCIRDLGLPSLVKNYPEPVIEQGIIPSDYADMYRDWHKKIAEGVTLLEAVIPLTKDRIPFHVRYTVSPDEAGRPLVAYGSATMVQNS